MTILTSKSSEIFLKNKSEFIFLIGSIFTSFGILLVTVGGSWDITNHLLSKPESFFSPPHALMYSGVAISLTGVVLSFVGWRNLQKFKDSYFLSLKIKLIGIGLLTGAGPLDFIWHSYFGLDGLLSPPHFTLITGMFLCSVGGMIGISRYLKFHNSQPAVKYLLILAVIPVWLSASGIISSLSLPFSSTDFFEFNPEPTIAFTIASLAYPFLISLSLTLIFRLSGYQFGMLSILGGLFLLIYSSTAIVPNFAMFDTIQFYSLNLIPFVISDIFLKINRSKLSRFFVGGLLGSVFYMIYYPYVMYTYNEILLGKLVSPSLIYFVYFELIQTVLIYTLIPAIIMGILGVIISGKLSKKIMMN
ncbi:hypothetical protein OAO63_00415 [Nitrosopumilus sp.]|nr:hypothetical protein [Nitrosopumilus sp.]